MADKEKLSVWLAQYREASSDHRHYGGLIWQLPALAILVGGSLIAVAFDSATLPLVRAIILGVASLFQFVMTSALVRYRLFQRSKRSLLKKLDKKLVKLGKLDAERNFSTLLEKMKFGEEIPNTGGMRKNIWNMTHAYRRLQFFMVFLTIFVFLLFLYSIYLLFPSFYLI